MPMPPTSRQTPGIFSTCTVNCFGGTVPGLAEYVPTLTTTRATAVTRVCHGLARGSRPLRASLQVGRQRQGPGRAQRPGPSLDPRGPGGSRAHPWTSKVPLKDSFHPHSWGATSVMGPEQLPGPNLCHQGHTAVSLSQQGGSYP